MVPNAPHLLNTITWEVRISVCEFEEDTNIQTIAGREGSHFIKLVAI